MANDNAAPTEPPPKVATLLRNSIYVTFNAPQRDEYHRSIFITYPHTRDGTLYHAVYNEFQDLDPSWIWRLERREVCNFASARSVVLAYRLGGLSCGDREEGGASEEAGDSDAESDGNGNGAWGCKSEGKFEREAREEQWFQGCEEALLRIDMNGDRDDDLVQRLGRCELAGYSCLVWSVDAVAALKDAGLVELRGKGVEEALMEARVIAGPPDGRVMVGKHCGNLRVVNH